MKIEGRLAQIRTALATQGPEAVRELMETAQATPAEIRSVLEEMGTKLPDIEKLLGRESPRTLDAPTPGLGQKAHDVRAKKQPWWSGLPTPALLHPEPPRDVEVHGEKLSKDDVSSMLRSLAS